MKIKHLFTITTGFVLMLVSASSSYAQAVNLKEPDPFQSNEKNPLHGEGNFNPLDFIHNANLLNNRSGADFWNDTNENLDDAAAEFKKQQLLRMQQQELESKPDSIEDTP